MGDELKRHICHFLFFIFKPGLEAFDYLVEFSGAEARKPGQIRDPCGGGATPYKAHQIGSVAFFCGQKGLQRIPEDPHISFGRC